MRQNALPVVNFLLTHKLFTYPMIASNVLGNTRRMNIVLVTETFPPEINGVSMSLHRVVENLSALGHTIEVVCPRRDDRVHLSDSGMFGVQMVPGLPLPRYEGLRFGLPAGGALLRRWRTLRPDLIHVATEGPLGWSAVRAARKLRIPFITTFHTNFHSYGAHYGFSFLNKGVLWWLRTVRRHAARTFVPSSGLREELAAAGFQRLSILGRGVDTALYSPEHRDDALRAEWGAAPDTPVALYVGRIAGEKNVPLTIKAYQEMRRMLPDLKLVLVGDGPERPRLEREHPDLHFAGMRRGKDLARHYASGDIFPFASTTETFGNVITEAMASGLVVLSYNYAAAQDHVRDGVNGRTAPINNPAAYLEAARKLARERNRWPELRTAARATALQLSWRHIVEGFAAELSQLLPSPSPTQPAATSISLS